MYDKNTIYFNMWYILKEQYMNLGIKCNIREFKWSNTDSATRVTSVYFNLKNDCFVSFSLTTN